MEHELPLQLSQILLAIFSTKSNTDFFEFLIRCAEYASGTELPMQWGHQGANDRSYENGPHRNKDADLRVSFVN
jgi:hypothetical protein